MMKLQQKIHREIKLTSISDSFIHDKQIDLEKVKDSTPPCTGTGQGQVVEISCAQGFY
jgi:hypothetical protein